MDPDMIPVEHIVIALMGLCLFLIFFPRFEEYIPLPSRAPIKPNYEPDRLPSDSHAELLIKRLQHTRRYLAIALSANEEFQKFFDYHRDKIDRLTKRDQVLQQYCTALKDRNATLLAAYKDQEEDQDDLEVHYEQAMSELDDSDRRHEKLRAEMKSLEMSRDMFREETGYQQEEMDKVKRQLAAEQKAHFEELRVAQVLREESESYNKTLQNIWEEKTKVERELMAAKERLLAAGGEDGAAAGPKHDGTLPGSEADRTIYDDFGGSEGEGEGTSDEDISYDKVVSPCSESETWSAIDLGLDVASDKKKDNGDMSSCSSVSNEGRDENGFKLNW